MDYQAKGKNMVAYLKIAGGQLRTFKWFKMEQVSRAKTIKDNSLARLASGLEDRALSQVSMEILTEASTKESVKHVVSFDPSPS